MFGRRKYIADMKLKRIFSFFLMLVMLLTMFPTAYAAGEVPDGEVSTEGVHPTETQPMNTEPTEGQDEYAVAPIAAADKYAYTFIDTLSAGLTYNKNDVVLEFFTDEACTDLVTTWKEADGFFTVSYGTTDLEE